MKKKISGGKLVSEKKKIEKESVDNGSELYGKPGPDAEALMSEDEEKLEEGEDHEDAEDALHEDEEHDEEDVKKEGDDLYDPNLNSDEENRRLKLLPEDESDDAILKKFDDKDEKAKKKEDDMATVKESLEALFEGEQVTAEFKEKFAALFEATTKKMSKVHVESVKNRAIEIIKENRIKTQERLIEATEKLINGFAKIYFAENRLAVFDGVSVQLAEGALKAQKDYFSKFNVKVPRSRENLVEKLSAENAKLRKQNNESLKTQIKLQESLDDSHKKTAIQLVSEGLSDTDKEKFKTMAEEVSFKDEASYRTKLNAIKEGMFGSKKTSADDFADKMLVTEKKEENKPSETQQNPSIAAYLTLG